MTILEAIKKQFSLIGVMTDEGAVSFAIDYSLEKDNEATDADLRMISSAFDAFLNKYAMRSNSVSENGFSFSWSEAQNKHHLMIMLRKYGVTMSNSVYAELGLSVIKDATKKW